MGVITLFWISSNLTIGFSCFDFDNYNKYHSNCYSVICFGHVVIDEEYKSQIEGVRQLTLSNPTICASHAQR